MNQSKERRKELQEAYKNRKIVGGVYKIINTKTGKYFLSWTNNIESKCTAFEFAKKANNCFLPHLQKEWTQYGGDIFTIEVVEQLDKKKDQTMDSFQEDIKVVCEMWKENDPDGDRY